MRIREHLVEDILRQDEKLPSLITEQIFFCYRIAAVLEGRGLIVELQHPRNWDYD